MVFLLILILIMIIFMLSFNLMDSNIIFLKMFSKTEIECGMYGFLNKNSSSLIYFLFLIVFLIFDLEIVLFFSFINKMMILFYLLILLMVIFSLVLELYECSIKWND